MKTNIFMLLVLATGITTAQITVDYTSYSAQQLVNNYLVTGGCVSATNITYTGHNRQLGYFSDANSGVGFSEGLVLSTGHCDDVAGDPSNFSSFEYGGGLGNPGDTDLDAMTGGTTADASVLEFDFVAQGDKVEFRYSFGSEEYPEFVCSDFNDVFAFFISGANPLGGNYTNYNMALLPSATPVTINNINHGYGDGIYTTSDPDPCTIGTPNEINEAFYLSNNLEEVHIPGSINNINLAFDGYTVVLTAEADVVPCQTYHMKLAIADMMDASYDSGIFLEANSFSNGNNVAIASSTVTGNNALTYEGCSSELTFTLDQISSGSTDIIYSIGGTSTNGSDYPNLSGTATILDGQTSATINLTPFDDGINEGIESLTISTSSGCACAAPIVYNFDIDDAQPVVISTSADQTICDGESVNLTSSASGVNPISYLWDNSGGSNSGASFTPTSSTTYNVTATDACGTNSTEPIAITVSNPIALINPTQTINCNTTSVNLDGSSSTGSNFSWSGPNVTNGGSTNSATVASGGTYTLTASIGSCNDQTNIIVMEDTTTPTVLTNASNQLDCINSESTLNGTGSTSGSNINYTWSTSNGNISGLSNTISTTVNSTGDYTLTVNNSDNGCESFETISITEDLSTPNIIIDPTGDIDCNNTNQLIDASSSDNGTNINYTWTTNNGTISGGNNGNTVNVSSAGDYTLGVLNSSNGCESTETVTINDIGVYPNVSTGTEGLINCNAITFTIDASSTDVDPNLNLQWSSISGNFIDVNDPYHPIVDAGGYYVLNVENLLNGCTSFDSVLVNVDTISPAVTVSPYGELTCLENSITLDASGSSGNNLNYSWSTLDGNISIDNTSEIEVDQDGTYELLLLSDNGCIAIEDYVVGIDTVSPNLTIDPADILNCNNETLALNASSNANTYEWTTTNGNILNGETTLAPEINQSGSYLLTVIGDNGCMNNMNINILQSEAPSALFLASAESGEIGLNVDFTNLSDGQNISYLWDFNNGITSNLFNPSAIFNDIGNYVVTLKVTDEYGCEDEYSLDVDINVVSTLHIPDVFTPNVDGYNDTFHPEGEFIDDFSCQIFNRWGELIFKGSKLNHGWDGRNESGQMVPAGTYYYMIKATGMDRKNYEKHGSLTLVY